MASDIADEPVQGEGVGEGVHGLVQIVGVDERVHEPLLVEDKEEVENDGYRRLCVRTFYFVHNFHLTCLASM